MTSQRPPDMCQAEWRSQVQQAAARKTVCPQCRKMMAMRKIDPGTRLCRYCGYTERATRQAK